MSSFTRAEMEEAFAHYQEVAATAASSGDWRPWADLFTEDATYIEHLFGEFHGREEIYRWISKTMSSPPNPEMNAFPVDWYVIDEARGWVVCAIWNRMADPGDGTLHQAVNWTLLKYAGDNRWSSEEDLYNPQEFGVMIDAWQKARDARGA
jgi:SnoaL-like domain